MEIDDILACNVRVVVFSAISQTTPVLHPQEKRRENLLSVGCPQNTVNLVLVAV
jgi:hypothetical protein